MVTAEQAREWVAGVPDPELPAVTIADLGILRDVRVEGDAVRVQITPTYSGCPAMDEIRADVEAVLHAHGVRDVRVELVLSPPWTTEWLSDAGRRSLAAHGIAPPRRTPGSVHVPLGGLTCPRCGSRDTEELSRFGATACRSLWRCRSCREPIDHLKDH